MSTEAQIALWGLATCAPLLVSWSARRLAAQSVATMLVVGWCVGRISWAFSSPPAHALISPFMDLVFGVIVFRQWQRDRAWWMLCVVALFMSQLSAHAAYLLAFPEHGTPYQKWFATNRYTVANNVLYALQLFVVAWAGGLDGLVRRLCAGVLGRLGRHRHAGASR